MDDYKDKLSAFKDNLKDSKVQTPMQEVKPLLSKKRHKREPEIKTTIEIERTLLQKAKIHCIKEQISFKEFLNNLLRIHLYP